ncbi:MAG TPA: TM0106 family RecB-like putative nuclease [Syntrophales bacterium]|nr:TM0106 family RecB-like putative nuclease [Syntrophales bacterium]HPI56901.1 TM0106 family RecB-like putative nuclease [Syntrophales bacterium]HPN23487.1 TM0106 family RecB-like putative nuclease [Syntrophales bacterium]HQM27988.1 TM0106 family RecB-like putative nuclease [Syntrophales bacterium]
MSKTSDIYRSCTAGPFRGELTAQNVSIYFRSPFSIYCEKFVPASEKDPLNPYRELLQERGIEHEKAVLERLFPGVKRIPYTDAPEGFRLLLHEMERGAEAIFGLPLLYLPGNMQGRFDLLAKRTDHASVFGPYHYVVGEIKVSKNIRPEHILQGAFYTWLLSKIQKRLPEMFFIINRDFEERAYKFKNHEEELLQALQGTQAILDGREVPTPTYNAGEWPWKTHTNGAALRSRDISLVSQVGPRLKEKLASLGFRKVWDLSPSRLHDLKAIPRVGERTAKKLIRSAQAIQKGEVMLLDPSALDFPARPVEIFLDLEGTDQPGDDGDLTQVDYLIGVLTCSAGIEEYRPFVAWHPEDEEAMFRAFMAHLASQKNYTVYHWHNYERWHMKQLADRYGMTAEAEATLFPFMIDLHRMATAAFVFPTYTNGLKDVAFFLGYRWRHEDINALDAIAYYLRFQKNPGGYREKLQAVIDYNEDDCRATKIVKDWLQARSPAPGRRATD